MDYARKIGKSNEPKKWVKKFTTAVWPHDGLISQDPVYVEDHRLANWETWLKTRRKQHERFKSKTGRQSHDQALNSCEKVRAQAEMRELIDYASVPVPTIPDKYRGGPEFWKTPETLSKNEDSHLSEIALTRTKKELNIIPELTHVSMPELIEKEKDLLGLRSKVPLWKRSRYLAKRKTELSKEIEILLPKKPETRDLVIKNRTVPKKQVLKRIPPITISGVESETEEESCHKNYPEQAIVLKIGEREIVWKRSTTKDDRKITEPITWSLSFSSKINNISEKEIVLENKGNRVIIYHWREATFLSNQIPSIRRSSPFFFNKTKGTILPGQIVKVPIWYKSSSSCVSVEYWKLVTSPILSSSPLIFRLWGCTAGTTKSSCTELIDKYLDGCIRETVIREIIEDIMDDMDTFEYPGPAYGSLFLESELFSVKNPLCFYNPSVAAEFHEIYCVATNQKEHRWNMSIRDLREILLESVEHRNILQPFSQLCKECLKPTLYRSIRYNKEEAVYNLLGAFFNLFETESEFAKGACLTKKRKKASSDPSLEGSASSTSREFENNVRNERGDSCFSRFDDNHVHKITNESSLAVVNDQLYKHIFFLRVYNLLELTITRIFATIESFNSLSEPDK